jgi:hypothetical protein
LVLRGALERIDHRQKVRGGVVLEAGGDVAGAGRQAGGVGIVLPELRRQGGAPAEPVIARRALRQELSQYSRVGTDPADEGDAPRAIGV